MRKVLLSCCLVLAAATTTAAARERYVDIEKRLSAEQMQATGLNQLSPSQLALLNDLLRDDQKAVVQAAEAQQAGRKSGGMFARNDEGPVAATLQGEFRGWSNGTRLTLDNGQTWQVTEGSYAPRKAEANPKVTVSPGRISGWYLQVEGHNPSAKVRRVD